MKQARSRNQLKQKVKTARGRKISSKLWLERQLNDPYVKKAREMGVRGRAYFKIEEIDKRFKVIKKGGTVIDLGCAPGGWCQYAGKRHAKFVLGVDILETKPIEGAVLIQQDFMKPEAIDLILSKMPRGQKVDCVISDMAANTTGHKQTDHLKTTALVEKAYFFARQVLNKDGAFVAKLFRGGAEKELLDQLKHDFEVIKHFKPDSSRKDSVEIYIVATGFKGE
ncbi:MAG: RlmE family RNA methyltransferase [Alphaproteobacteria bacterium]|jgi:23S rRNA (uridine2552-2'-O)-methyltransferase|nr:RlmE family RNA methyltransferase [Alphaproteobacteria bacterium]